MTQCYLNIQNNVGKLSDGENIIGQYILEHPQEVVEMSIDRLAELCKTSKSTVVRFCKDLGYKGYKDLCMQLQFDLINNSQDKLNYSDIHPGDSAESVMNSIAENNIKTIKNTVEVIKRDKLDEIIRLMLDAPRIDFYGVGNSGFIALDAQSKFLRIGKQSMAQTDSHMQLLAVSSLKKTDVVVAVSYSGETKDILDTVRAAKERGAAVVSLTRYGENALSRLADYDLHTVSEEGTIRSGAMSSRIGQLTIIDILFTLVAGQQFEDAKIHLEQTEKIIKGKKTEDYC